MGDFLGTAMAYYEPGSVSLEVTGMVAEGDQVTLEWTSRARTAAGEPYENFCIGVFTVRDGRIAPCASTWTPQYASPRGLRAPEQVWSRPARARWLASMGSRPSSPPSLSLRSSRPRLQPPSVADVLALAARARRHPGHRVERRRQADLELPPARDREPARLRPARRALPGGQGRHRPARLQGAHGHARRTRATKARDRRRAEEGRRRAVGRDRRRARSRPAAS